MRFFFEFVSCCGLPTQRSPEPAVPAKEDERWLVPATAVTVVPSRLPHRKKMRMGSAEWRPSLGSISEDVAPPQPRDRESPRKGSVASAGRDSKKRSAGGGGAAKVRHRSFSDSYYGSAPSMPTMIPAFSPTPFMF